jgi:small subunit ribosomal protein S3Ae
MVEKKKEWYNVYAPKIFDEKLIAEIPASEEKSILGRKINIRLDELTGDFSQVHTYVNFKVNKVDGKNAYTEIVGIETLRTYISTLVRKRRSLIEDLTKITVNGKNIIIKYVIFFDTKVSSSAETAARKTANEELEKISKNTNFDKLINDIINKEIQKSLLLKLKKIAPTKRFEIRKIEIK